MGWRLWPRLAPIDRYSNILRFRNFPSGQRRIAKDPPAESIMKAFEELGTRKAVAAALGVDRNVVTRWISQYNLDVESRPEVRHSNFVRRVLKVEAHRIRVAQWVVDEGSIGVTYNSRSDLTSLLVCGSMNDYDAISSVSTILQTPCNCARTSNTAALPMLGVRMISAKAYALLEILLPYMFGLKAMEARAALAFFPKNGILHGRHTTDEFLVSVWKEFAITSLGEWSKRRQHKLTREEIQKMSDVWVEGRIKRARRFLKAPA